MPEKANYYEKIIRRFLATKKDHPSRTRRVGLQKNTSIEGVWEKKKKDRDFETALK